MMRILNVLPWSPLTRVGGYETFVKETGKELVRRGHSVFVLGHVPLGPRFHRISEEGILYVQIGNMKPQGYSTPKVSIRYLFSLFRYIVGTIPYLAKVIVLYDIDSVIFYREQFQAPLAITARLFGGRPWLAHVVIRRLRGSGSLWHWLNRALINCFSGVFTYVRYFNTGEQFIDNLAELRRHKPSRIFFLPGGIDTTNIERLEPKPWMQQAKENVDYLVVCPRRLTVQKGAHVLLESIPKVISGLRGEKPLFVFAHDGELRTYIQVRSRSLGIEQFVLVSPEPLVGTLMCELIKCADLVVVPSLSEEDFGMVFLEAWSAKVPVVSTNVGGIAGVISDGVTGVLVAPGDRAHLAEAIVSLLHAPDLRRKLAESGFKMVNSRFNIHQVASALANILEMN
jgi:glycosyltransferase involved in cell wall biosynthesis